MAKQKAGRKRRTHDGIKVLGLGDGRFVARWRDPLSGRQVQTSLDKLGLRSDAARRTWAQQKSTQLAELRQAVALGAAAGERVTVADAVEQYLVTVEHLPTRAGKTLPLRSLAKWLGEAGCHDLTDVSGALLVRAWRDRATSAREGRAPRTVNQWLAAAGTFLRWARKRGYCPRLTLEGIADASERVATPTEAPEFLRPEQVRQLLGAVLEYDAGDARRRPVAPFLLGLLLSGCRLRELGDLTWGEVQPDGLHLAAGRTKTRRARVVEFGVAPSLQKLLVALRGPREPSPDALVFGRVVQTWTVAVVRLVARYGAPTFTAHTLRRTCGTTLTNATGIYAGASAWHSAKRLGHSVEIAERLYVGHLRDLPADAKTIEAALGIEELAARIVAAAAS
jgi:integrase